MTLPGDGKLWYRSTENTNVNPRPADPPSEQTSISELIGFELKRAQAESGQLFTQMMEHTSLKPADSLLHTLAHHPSETLKSVAKRLAIDRANLVPLLDDLERLKYIERIVDTRDRRVRALSLTPLGNKMLKKCQPVVADHEKITKRKSASEKRNLHKSLTKNHQQLHGQAFRRPSNEIA